MKNLEYRNEMIRRMTAPTAASIYGGDGIAKMLYCPAQAAEGEAQLLRAARWFELPHPNGRDHRGEPDFVAQKLIRALYMLEDRLSPQTLGAIHTFFTEQNFESKYKSENHLMFFHASLYLYALKYPDARFSQFGKPAEEVRREERDFLHDFLQFRARCGWAEFDATGYGAEFLSGLLNLIDFAEPDMSRLARMCADLQLMDMIADSSKNGFYGGAHGRIYAQDALDYENAAMCGIYRYYFAQGLHRCSSLEAVASEYEPSDYVYAMLAQRPESWENYECKHLHSITFETPHRLVPQVPGRIVKYTYVTPKYVIGAVNRQDAYPEGSEAAWYAHHQQHEWDLSLCAGSDLRIFTHHPGSSGPEGAEHGYWTGDLGCCCGQFYCHQNVAMATYDIPPKEAPRIHAHIPLDKLDTAVEGRYLWFAHGESGVYGMLWMSNGIEPGSEAYAREEVQSFGRRHGVVCVVGTQEEYGSFASFRQTLRRQAIAYDPERRVLGFGDMVMRGEKRFLRNREVEFPWVTYENPMMHAAWGSGRIELRDVILDFNGWGSVIPK